jgi:hypothetical protein
MTTERNRGRALTLYLPQQLVKDLDKSRGALSLSRLVTLLLRDALARGIDFNKILTGESSQ